MRCPSEKTYDLCPKRHHARDMYLTLENLFETQEMLSLLIIPFILMTCMIDEEVKLDPCHHWV